MASLVRPAFAIVMLMAMWSTSSTSVMAQATGTVRGTVTEANAQRALSGAAVSVAGTSRRVVTGASGEYTLPGVPAGSVRIRVELVGYAPTERLVTVVAGQSATANFALGASAVALDELVVTGTAGDARRRTVGNAVSQIQAADVVATAPIN
ncbi:MAG: carboxypeptidase-like regulatory domain-containing protein, partial [Gemmatimonadota bacterium]|nr:carboxypeptidase-like regulatory domain-containing protein [Gemmatimonadota bacterium]